MTQLLFFVFRILAISQIFKSLEEVEGSMDDDQLLLCCECVTLTFIDTITLIVIMEHTKLQWMLQESLGH